ncbi:Ribosome biogenesis protein erb1, partial [Ceratobasidium sp. 392]
MPHIGYTIDGKKVLRPARGDELDKFLSTVEDPTSWTSALDKSTMQDTQLTAQELDIIKRLQQGENPDGNYDPYEPTVEWFTGKGKEEIMPLSAKPEPKRRFVPSKWEKQKVMKIVRAIRAGRILPRKPTTSETAPRFYSLWSTPASDHPAPLPAPKPAPPTTAESYNPPEEYLPTEEETTEFNETEKQDRERNFLPKKHSALRLVPAYPQFAQERFDRLLDLYLAPRVQRTKLNIDPNSLIPSLPSPASLRPFPTHEAALCEGAAARVRCVCVSPDGAWVLTGDEGGVVRLWEMLVGREAAKWVFEGKIGAVAWCPRADATFFVVGVEDAIHYLIPPFIAPGVHALTTSLLNPANLPPRPESSSPSLKWVVTPATSTARATKASSHSSPVLTVLLPAGSGLPKQIVFHRKGDYLASVSGNESQGAVWIHQTSKRHSQAPFRKVKGAVQCVLFHPLKPHFFVAPLFASASDDGTIQVFYARVYSDLMTDPLIVPLKVLRGHKVSDGLGVLDVAWSEQLPWLASAGADGTMRRTDPVYIFTPGYPASPQPFPDTRCIPSVCSVIAPVFDTARRTFSVMQPHGNNRASLLAGLRTGGVRSVSGANVPHTAAPGGSFQIPRFASQAHGYGNGAIYEDDEDILAAHMQQMVFNGNGAMGPRGMMNGGAPMTASLADPNRFQQQQQLMMMQMLQNQGVMGGGFNGSLGGLNAEQQALQLQLQNEILMLQAKQQQQQQQFQAQILAQAQAQQAQLQAQLQAAQAAQQAQSGLTNGSRLNPVITRRVSAANAAVPSTAGPLQTTFNLGNGPSPRRALSIDQDSGIMQPPMTASLGGRFGARAPSLPATTGLNPNAAAFSFGPRVSSPVKEKAEEQFERDGTAPPNNTPQTATYASTTVISGGTSLGAQAQASATPAVNASPSKANTALSWRRPSVQATTTSPPGLTRQLTSSPPFRDQSPVSASSRDNSRVRPQPLRFNSGLSSTVEAAQSTPSSPEPDVVATSADGVQTILVDNGHSTGSRSPVSNSPTTPVGGEPLPASREEASKR